MNEDLLNENLLVPEPMHKANEQPSANIKHFSFKTHFSEDYAAVDELSG